METLQLAGLKVVPFAYPFDRDPDMLRLQMEKMMSHFGVSWSQANEQKKRLDAVRSKIWEIDRLTWQENLVGGWDNHIFQLSSSDFNGEPEKFAAEAELFIEKAKEQPPREGELRLGYIGVPPIVGEIYDFLE